MTDAALLTPRAVRIVEQYDDGQDARHYVFEPIEPPARSAVAVPRPGQFFMLSVPRHGEAPFTYVSVDGATGRFVALVRRVGSLTSALFELHEGAVLGARGPLGRGWPVEELTTDRVLVAAGGCGLAPLCSALEALVQRRSGRCALIYGSRSEASQVLAGERARFARELPLFETFDHPSQPGHSEGTPLRTIPAARAALGGIDAALICGPETMMHATAEALVQSGLPRERIWLSLERRMHCGVGLCGHCYVADGYACKQGPTYRYDELLALLAKSPPREPALTEVRHC
jgi:anaerobic sulfite reductase subunit B